MAHTSGKSNHDDSALKGLIKELEMLNRRGNKGKTIESSNTFQDLSPNTSREDLFKLVKELYCLSKKALEQAKKKSSPGTSTEIPNSDQFGQMIREQLSGILPDMLKDALAANGNRAGCSKETSVPAPTTVHTLELKKRVDESVQDDEELTMISDKDWTTVVKKDVKGALKKVPVMKTVTSSKATAKLHFESKDHLDLAERALQDKYHVTSRSEEKRKLNPKLTISDLDEDITSKEIFMEELKEKNSEISNLAASGEELKIVFLDPKEKLCVLQVSPCIREAIRTSGDKVCIGLQRHTVKDRFHVLQCFHCQEFGHKAGSEYCKKKDEDPCCFFCAGRHSSKDCENRKTRKTDSIKCVNCQHSKNHHEKSSCATHKASDTLCPFYVRERSRIMSRTAGCEESKNFYLKKVQETKRKLGRN